LTPVEKMFQAPGWQ